MQGEDLGPWAMFLGGKWQKNKPSEPGVYPVASREGDPLSAAKWIELIPDKFREGVMKQVGLKHGEPGWQGWWWSRPVPSLPSARDWV